MPASSDINSELAKAVQYHQSGQLRKAEEIYKRILEVNPNHSDSLHLLGVIAHQVGKIDMAVGLINKAIQHNPGNPIYYNNLANALIYQGKSVEAIFYYQKALELKPDYADAHNNMGSALKDQGRLVEAITCYQKTLELKPNSAEVHNNMGNALKDQGKLAEATSCFQKALDIKPNLAEAYNELFHQFQQTCTWQKLEDMLARFDEFTANALKNGTKTAETPFISLSRYSDLSRNFAIAKSWSDNIARAMSTVKTGFSFDGRRSRKAKISIGYLSNDFRNHAMAHLMLSLFGLHNRDEFEILCYSYGEDDRSHYRTRIRQDCDKSLTCAT